MHVMLMHHVRPVAIAAGGGVTRSPRAPGQAPIQNLPWSLLSILGVTFNIKDAEADRLARELAAETGESLTAAVTTAVRERLERVRARRSARRLADELDEIARRCAALPTLDDRSEDEILGYDEHGLPR